MKTHLEVYWKMIALVEGREQVRSRIEHVMPLRGESNSPADANPLVAGD
jgi:hypothetical protein